MQFSLRLLRERERERERNVFIGNSTSWITKPMSRYDSAPLQLYYATDSSFHTSWIAANIIYVTATYASMFLPCLLT